MAMYGLISGIVIGMLLNLVLAKYFSHYASASVFVWIALFAFFFRCLNFCMTAFIQAAGKFHVIRNITYVNILFFSLAATIGIREGGAIGLSLSVVATEIVNSALQFSSIFKTYRIPDRS
jgi:O-antigen/teichoic acid export membrane protein